MEDKNNWKLFVLAFALVAGFIAVMQFDLFLEVHFQSLPLEEIWIVSGIVLLILVGAILKIHHDNTKRKKLTIWEDFKSGSIHDKLSFATLILAMILLILISWSIDQGHITLSHLQIEEEWIILAIGGAAWLFGLRRMLLPQKKK